MDKDAELASSDANDGEHQEGLLETPGGSTLALSTSLTMDYRILWIRDRVIKFLGLNGEHKILFDNLINENNRYYEDKLYNFLILDLFDVTDLDKKLLLFYKTYRSEVVQEEISVYEESRLKKITAVGSFAAKGRLQRLTKSAPGKSEMEIICMILPHIAFNAVKNVIGYLIIEMRNTPHHFPDNYISEET